MRAQLTKNAVIVPAGAKGGFYLKRPPADREELKAEVERQYVRYIRGAARASPTTSSTARSCTRAACACSTATTPTSSSPPTRARRRSRTPPTAVAERARLLARRRVRLRRLGGLRPQGARDHRPRRLGVGQAPLPRARRRPRPTSSPSSASATCPATCSATGCCCRDTIRLVAAYDHRHVFIDPDPDAAAVVRGAQAAVRAARLVLGRLRPRADLRGRRRLPAHGQVDPALRRRRARRSGIDDERAAADRRHPRDPARARRPALERRHRHGRQGLDRDRRRRAGPRLATRSASTRASCAPASWGRAATSASRAARASSTPRGGGRDQRRLHRQLGRRRLLRPRGQPEDPARPGRARAAS